MHRGSIREEEILAAVGTGGGQLLFGRDFGHVVLHLAAWAFGYTYNDVARNRKLGGIRDDIVWCEPGSIVHRGGSLRVVGFWGLRLEGADSGAAWLCWKRELIHGISRVMPRSVLVHG